MIEKKNKPSTFVLHFIEQVNSDKPIDQKIMELLIHICEYFDYKRGFIYQTDGFRFFHLKESYGVEDETLRDKFEIDEMTVRHVERMRKDTTFFYAKQSADNTPDEKEILDFYNAKSLLVSQIKDTE